MIKIKYLLNIILIIIINSEDGSMGIGDWGLGIGDWGLGIGDWAQSPIPNPQSPNYVFLIFSKICLAKKISLKKILNIIKLNIIFTFLIFFSNFII